MEANSVIVALVSAVSGGIASQVCSPVIGGFFGHRTAIQSKQIVDGTNINAELWKRLERFEDRLSHEEKRSGRLERVLERVCWGYEDLRQNMLRVVRSLREDHPVDKFLLDELEKTPDIRHLLGEILDENEADIHGAVGRAGGG
jgi:hypothetical protein